MGSPDCYEPHPDHAAGEIGEEAAIVINPATGVYYGLGGVGRAIWLMVTERRDVRAMVDELTASYAVEPSEAERDVRRVLHQLAGEGVIRPADAEPALTRPRGTASREPYLSPAVETYRDMQDLLALDPLPPRPFAR